MQCSKCDSVIIPSTINEINADYCPKCHAYWIEADGIKNVFNYFLQHPQELIMPDSPSDTNMEPGFCPRCNMSAMPVKIHKQNISFLKCISCNGIWIDHYNIKQGLKWWKKNKNSFDGNMFGKSKSDPLFRLADTGEVVNTIKEDNPTIYISEATILIIILNIILFFIYSPLNSSGRSDSFIPSEFLNNPGVSWPYIFSSMFMHTGWEHLTWNMVYLFIFGNNIEDRIGPIKYILFYLFMGTLTLITYAFITNEPNRPMIGSEYAISAIIGAYLLLYPKVNFKITKAVMKIPFTITIPAWAFILLWFPINIFIANMNNMHGIVWLGYITGIVYGYVGMFFMKKLNFL